MSVDFFKSLHNTGHTDRLLHVLTQVCTNPSLTKDALIKFLQVEITRLEKLKAKSQQEVEDAFNEMSEDALQKGILGTRDATLKIPDMMEKPIEFHGGVSSCLGQAETLLTAQVSELCNERIQLYRGLLEQLTT